MGATATFIILSGILGWQLRTSLKENGIMSQQVAQLEQSAKDWERSYDDLQTIYESTQRSVIENSEAKKIGQEAAKYWMERYELEKKSNEELRIWASRNAPDVWWDGVRNAAEDLNTKRNREADTSE